MAILGLKKSRAIWNSRQCYGFSRKLNTSVAGKYRLLWWERIVVSNDYFFQCLATFHAPFQRYLSVEHDRQPSGGFHVPMTTGTLPLVSEQCVFRQLGVFVATSHFIDLRSFILFGNQTTLLHPQELSLYLYQALPAHTQLDDHGDLCPNH